MDNPTKTALAIAGAGAIAYFILRSAADKVLANIKIDIGNPQMDNTPFLSGAVQVDVPVSIQNNNSFALDIQSFYGVVSYGDITLSNVSIPIGFIVASASQKTITLDMNIPINTVLNDVIAAIQSGNIFNTLINKLYLTGALAVNTPAGAITIPLNRVAIPIV